jgi:hypothetical protein
MFDLFRTRTGRIVIYALRITFPAVFARNIPAVLPPDASPATVFLHALRDALAFFPDVAHYLD